MASTPLADFVDLARRDAAIQERVVSALKQANPVSALLALTREAGFHVSEADLAATLNQALDDRALDAVAGGYFDSKEWFAEFRSLGQPRKIQGD